MTIRKYYRDEEQWVHERDYGGNGLGGMILGLFEIVSGLVMLVVYLFRRKK